MIFIILLFNTGLKKNAPHFNWQLTKQNTHCINTIAQYLLLIAYCLFPIDSEYPIPRFFALPAERFALVAETVKQKLPAKDFQISTPISFFQHLLFAE